MRDNHDLNRSGKLWTGTFLCSKFTAMRVDPTDSVIPLRHDGPLIQPFKSLKSDQPEPPRALKALGQIVENDLCHRCGSCVGICPTEVLGLDQADYPVVKNMSACTDCDLCVKVCPGDEFNYPEFYKKTYGVEPDNHDVYGHFENGYISHSTDDDIRARATSGGFVTGFLAYLIESGYIDGAMVVVPDEKVPWKGVPKIARTREELISAMKSKYSIVGTNSIFTEMRDTPGKYAMVVLPCQMHGVLKAMELDKRLRERIVFTIGLLCHASLENEGLSDAYDHYASHRPELADKVKKFYFRVGKHPGSSFVEFEDGERDFLFFPKKKNYHPDMIEMANVLYRLYTPKRCITCFDSHVEFADMAVGDPWMPLPVDGVNFHDGYTYVVTRNKEADRLMEAAVAAGHLKSIKIDKKAAKLCNRAMGTEKRHRAFRIIESDRFSGKPVPEYFFEAPSSSLKHKILTEINILTHSLCFLPGVRRAVLRCILSPVGYYLLWLNKRRRNLRTKWRDYSAKRKRDRGQVNVPPPPSNDDGDDQAYC